MPIKRRVAKAGDHRITPEASAAFVAGDWKALHNALRLRLWEPSPLDVTEPELPVGVGERDALREGWPQAWALRQELEGQTSADEDL